MSETIQLPVRAKHFYGSVFFDACNCPLAKAAKEHFDAKIVVEGRDEMLVDDKEYRHLDYNVSHFQEDWRIAHEKQYDDTLIRTITLHPA